MMATRLLLFLCLTGHVFAKEPPDVVECLVMHLEYIHCSWNKDRTPEVNYTFYSWFSYKTPRECPSYFSENSINTGCKQPYLQTGDRFSDFNTKLVHGNDSYEKKHELKERVKFNPPTNVTVQYGLDSNLWLNWTQISYRKVESQVRYRINNKPWMKPYYPVSAGIQYYCINLPSSALYELQVRSKLDYMGGGGKESLWSDWSEPVFWGSKNSSTDSSMSVWTPVLYGLGASILILLVMMLLHQERIRIVFIPVVPKPSPKLHNVEDWFQFPNGLKESFKYNERPCPVREYCHVPESDSESSDYSTCSGTTDQTDCSVSIPVNESDLPTSCSSSTSTVSPEEEKQVSV
ncbi:hypothetical protein CgunFtcFv8_002990 [Champsocephalus gunnari]|uniref:Fibronectin type-III domain-containing protein n=1 Tax=Champsocephalus gunnari TaxID=52237 RepID=A0AAN8DHZ3_CHAGU|nr:hypothetical protein CgunFtcFv8_002990 [Champsocephalus gunnari]